MIARGRPQPGAEAAAYPHVHTNPRRDFPVVWRGGAGDGTLPAATIAAAATMGRHDRGRTRSRASDGRCPRSGCGPMLR